MPASRKKPSPLAKLMTINSIRVYYERDLSYLGLIGSFIQDAPQLMLQIYILAVKYKLRTPEGRSSDQLHWEGGSDMFTESHIGQDFLGVRKQF